MSDPLLHTATVEVAVPAEKAFAFLADIANTPKWLIGIMLDWKQTGERTASGRSLIHGTQYYLGLEPEPELLWMPLFVGLDPAELLPAAAMKVLPGPSTRRSPDTCLVSMLVWQVAGGGMGAEYNWEVSGHIFPVEMDIVKHHLEGHF